MGEAIAAVVPMRSGEIPTEAGWYVMDGEQERFVTEIFMSAGEAWFLPSRLRVLRSDRFVARIYVERITEEPTP